MDSPLTSIILTIVGVTTLVAFITFYFSYYSCLIEHYDFEVYDIDLKWDGTKSWGYFKLWNSGGVDIVHVELEVNGSTISWDRVIKKGRTEQFYVEDLSVSGVGEVYLKFKVKFANGKTVVKVYRSKVQAIIVTNP